MDKPLSVRNVVRTIRGRPTSDGAGVRLNRLIGSPEMPDLDPFLLLDEFRSDSASDYIAGFPDHPHRGFETVTYMLAGRMRHGDNQGNSGLLRPGSVQWMTAGRGIVHSEMPEQEDGLMWGFQLWVNLPAADKMTAPRYQDIDPENIPVVDLPDGGTAKVIAGEIGGQSGAVSAIATDPTFLDVQLPSGAAFTYDLPEQHHAFLYVFEGTALVGQDGREIWTGELAVLGQGERLVVTAPSVGPARFILVAGRPLKERVVRYGPFVMNSESQIREAIEDFRAGRF
jgi:redox-sensitive bicupin YhaK (pirin superfamily)